MLGSVRRVLCWLGISATLVLVGCSSTSLNRAPVEDRTAVGAKTPPVADSRTVVPPVKAPVAVEPVNKAGFYTVKPGDTLIRIGLDAGQSHKDIARWNGLENANKIEVGQVLRILPPGAGEGVAVAKPVVSSSVASVSIAAGSAASLPAKTTSAPAAVAVVASSGPTAAAGALGEDEIAWIWPGNGPVLAGFDDVKNKGVDIGGAAGDAVVAAAEGRVVYVGAALRGYGNLIILKHNNTYLTAYAHNQTLLVKEDQAVKKGQKIAEMGNSDADRVKLHFEVRRQGKPVDPIKYLPPK